MILFFSCTFNSFIQISRPHNIYGEKHIKTNEFLENKKYILSILKIIFLTNIPAIMFIASNPRAALGWFVGSIASGVNFYLLSTFALNAFASENTSNVRKSSRAFIFRYVFLNPCNYFSPGNEYVSERKKKKRWGGIFR